MSITIELPQLPAIAQKQQEVWASGDFAKVASSIVLSSERLADAAQLRAGWDVLDVACGSGNATIAAARHNTNALGVDYVPNLIRLAKDRAEVEGLDIDFQLADAEDLPFDDQSFDAVVSVFGCMFTPSHERAASEIARVTRPGGTVALASWVPDGFIGQMFNVIKEHAAPAPGIPSPMLWGQESHLRELFADRLDTIHSTVEEQPFRYASAQEFVTFFRRWYGPTLAAFGRLDSDQQTALNNDLVALALGYDRHGDGASIWLPATYLQTVMRLQ